jgi:hypothetical protein
MLDMDFEPTIEGENFIDEAILGALEECPLFHSVRLPKECPFHRVRFDIIWSILWVIKSETFDGFPARSHPAKNKHMSRSIKIFFKFSGQSNTMLGNTLLQWTKPGFVFQIILTRSGFHVINYHHLS